MLRLTNYVHSYAQGGKILEDPQRFIFYLAAIGLILYLLAQDGE